MNTVKRFVLLFFMVALLFSAYITAGINVFSVAIEAQNKKLMAAVKNEDAAALAALYTPDATVMPPNHEMVKGRKAIEAMWEANFKMADFDLKLTIVEADGNGDLAYEVGTFSMTTHLAGQAEPILDAGTYHVTWKQHDGEWLLHADSWNSSTPLPGQ